MILWWLPVIWQTKKDRDLVIETLEKCGFTINYKKSHLTPSTVIEFLGFVLDSDNMTITLTECKTQVLWKSIQAVLLQPSCPVSMRQLARIIGQMVAIFPASEVTGLHYRTLEHFKIKGLLRNKSWSSKMVLKFDLHFFSDASGGAWGPWSLVPMQMVCFLQIRKNCW